MDPAAYYYMPLFKPGVFVHLAGNRETVSHIVVRRNAMMIYLVGHESPVHPDTLRVAPTAFHLTRMPDRA